MFLTSGEKTTHLERKLAYNSKARKKKKGKKT
jgi:hypothetical protein